VSNLECEGGYFAYRIYANKTQDPI